MQRKLFFVSLLWIIILCTPTLAAESTVFSELFDDSAAFENWDGGFPEEWEEGLACIVNNGYGAEENGKVSHLLSYMNTVTLEEGRIYKISFNVTNLLGDSSGLSSSSIRFGDGRSNIIFEFDRIADHEVTASEFFMVPKTDDYSFGIELKNGGTDMGFMVDNIVIEEIDINPQSLTILGDTEITIPADGSIFCRYTIGAYTSQGEIINLLSEITSMKAGNLPAGVYFNSEENTLEVTENCPDNSSLIITCYPPDYLALEGTETEVFLSKNVLKNSDFSYGNNGWTVDGAYTLGLSSMTLYTETACPYGYYGVLRPSYPVVLMENVMYVLRAKVTVAEGNDFSVYSQNAVLSLDGQVSVALLNLPSGNGNEVVAAFTPEVSGVYDLAFSFITADIGEVVIHNITLTPELPDETRLTLHAPGNIAVPDTVTEYPVNAYIRDQAGNIMNSRCDLELYPVDCGVELDGNNIIVSPDAVAGDYEIYASAVGNSSINSRLVFTVSHEFVGDGRFEEKPAGQWWAAAAPAALRIEEEDSKFLHIVSDDDYAVVLNNSYMHLYPEFTYAFRGQVTDGVPSTVTVFLETFDGDRVPLIQSELEDNMIFELFQTDTELVGRLMLYITTETGEGVDLSLDDIELFRSIVSASSPVIMGLADSGAILTAQFNFFNNLDETNSPSDCAVSWYGTDGQSEPVHVGSGMEFRVLPNLVGKYVYFEVTPICAVTGLSGTPLQSVPVAIGEIQHGIPILPDPIETEITQTPSLSPVKLSEEMTFAFTDMDHWAEKYVIPLYNSKIVNGKTAESFCPDDLLTRCEFAAIVARAFDAKGGDCPFTDIPENAWYRDNVSALASLNIINGISEDKFAPDDLLTREQMLVILVRVYDALGYTSDKTSVSRFYDYGDISPWAEDAVGRGLAIGIINGTEQSTLLPKKYATRAEACTVLYRLLTAIENM